MTGWKLGDYMVMYFSIAGETSEDNCIVMDIDDDTVSLNDIFEDEDGNKSYRKFDRKTGECLNDNNWMGGKRRIKPCWAKPDNYVKPEPKPTDILDDFKDWLNFD